MKANFTDFFWMTPNQLRDYYLCAPNLTPEIVQELRCAALAEDSRRKLLPDFVRCSRCFGYHDQKQNIDKLCEKCEANTAPFRFDESRKASA